MLLLTLGLFLSQPAPLQPPRAEAYLVKEQGRTRLEDRFAVGDLWLGRVTLGRWRDDEGRIFTLYQLDSAPPRVAEVFETRKAYLSSVVPIGIREASLTKAAIVALAPIAPEAEPISPRMRIRGLKDVAYYNSTNANVLVAAVRPEKSSLRYLIVWNLVEGDDYDELLRRFENEFLSEWNAVIKSLPVRQDVATMTERELAMEAARWSVASYPQWHFTASDEVAVIDNLPNSSELIATITNEIITVRQRFAAAVPGVVNADSMFALVRIYANRDEYLRALSLDDNRDLAWSAAYFSPERREIVSALPATGTVELLRTLRHEAFHQYLAYVTGFLPVSPWLNEGYAKYFEDESNGNWQATLSLADYEHFAQALPAILSCNYEQFYTGSSAERLAKYQLAWSLANFLEKGAPEVRFKPFATLKQDYLNALLKSKDMSIATAAAVGTKDKLELLQVEWLKFYTR